MKKQFLMIMAAGAMSFAACTEDRGTSTETNQNDSSTPDNASGTAGDSTTSSNYDYDAEYRDRANRLTSQMSQDLALDTAAQARIRTVFYNRARHMNELQTRYTSTNTSAGYAADSAALATDNTQVTGYPEDSPTTYYNEMETLNSSVDLEVKGLLTPQQFKTYQANRSRYYADDMKMKTPDGAKMKADGDEFKIKAGDTKLKKDGDETKLKSGDTKVKKDGDESKLKTDDYKIKKDGNEVKYKSDETKIKLEN